MFMQFSIRSRARIRRLLGARVVRRLVRREDGAVAIEFAMVAAPFFALVFAIIETAIVFFAGQTLETAVADASRLILTGQAQQQGFSASAFKQAVCGKIYGLFDCTNGVKIDVQTFQAFGNANVSKPVDANGNVVNGFGQYQPGGPGDIVVVRAIYEWPVYINLLGFNLADMANGKRLIMATAAFRNEPYQ